MPTTTKAVKSANKQVAQSPEGTRDPFPNQHLLRIILVHIVDDGSHNAEHGHQGQQVDVVKVNNIHVVQDGDEPAKKAKRDKQGAKVSALNTRKR